MSKQYDSVQEMLEEIDPEIAEEFRIYQRRPYVRLRHFCYYLWYRLRRKR